LIYKVIAEFYDLNDGCHKYVPGDVFPRDGATATDKRIRELATDANRCGFPLIEEVAEERARKRVKKNAD